MKQRHLKNGSIRHYCEECGTPIYDEILVPSGVYVFGSEILEKKITKKHKPYIYEGMRIAGHRRGELCEDCVKQLEHSK